MALLLVVDDDKTVAGLLEIMLREEGYQVETTQGVYSFGIIEAFQPYLILMDIEMPYLSGLEICRFLKKTWDEEEAIPIILMSSGETYSKESREAGADAFLVKPFAEEELLRLIEQLVPERENKQRHDPQTESE